jgi:putative mRNA 3-end processing factor
MGADVIVTTSGMLEGGPVGQYIREHGGDARNAIFLTGYQVEGTNGRRLMDEGVITVNGEAVKVQCEMDYFDFSSHAGHSELARFVGRCDPENVVVMHSANPRALAEDPVMEGRNVVLPETGKTFTLPD